MKESRVFELNQVTAEQVLEVVTTFLRGEKGMEVQSVATPNGYLIQAALISISPHLPPLHTGR